jgi:hypothetical protein
MEKELEQSNAKAKNETNPKVKTKPKTKNETNPKVKAKPKTKNEIKEPSPTDLLRAWDKLDEEYPPEEYSEYEKMLIHLGPIINKISDKRLKEDAPRLYKELNRQWFEYTCKTLNIINGVINGVTYVDELKGYSQELQDEFQRNMAIKLEKDVRDLHCHMLHSIWRKYTAQYSVHKYDTLYDNVDLVNPKITQLIFDPYVDEEHTDRNLD